MVFLGRHVLLGVSSWIRVILHLGKYSMTSDISFFFISTGWHQLQVPSLTRIYHAKRIYGSNSLSHVLLCECGDRSVGIALS